ncbi:MAG: OmpA family protein [Flavobacteriales bacterium]|nr:OmpA family protein [Flavobacteriales bacterium]
MKIKLSLLLLSALLAFSAIAQKKKPAAEPEEVSDNLVPNSSFEDVNIKTLKNYGQLTELCKSWFSPQTGSADIFVEGVKSTKAASPANDFGIQSAYEGVAHAGVRAYTKDPKLNRTYIETQMTGKMVKDQLYCVKMQVSLADLSKYAVNNFGFFFSDRKIANANNNSLTYKPQVTEKTNRAIQTMDGWETICGTYLANGTEEFIIIGCFGLDNEIKVEKTKKPSGIQGTPTGDAYYYIDAIEILPVDATSQCKCGSAVEQESGVIYSRAGVKTPNMKPEELIAGTAVYFDVLSYKVHSMFDADLNELAGLLKSNPNLKIELIGHSDTDEVNEAKVNIRYEGMALKRANSVKEFLVLKGISEVRLSTSSKDNTELASDKPTPLSKAQNRRVLFVVK